MRIQAISPVKLNNVSFKANNVQSNPVEENKASETDAQKQQSMDSKKVSAIALASALSAAAITGAVMHGKIKSAQHLANENISRLTQKNQDLLNRKNEVTELNRKLQKEIAETKNKLNELIVKDATPKDLPEDIYNTMKSTIDKADYGYDISKPPVTGIKTEKQNMADAIDLPVSGTNNRSYIRELSIPEIKSDGSFDYELPMTKDVKIAHSASVDFKPVKSMPTSVSEKYADSVQWDNNKIARDVLQNFFDGHGQTLDGVKMHFEPISDGKYKVRIEGKSTYTPDKAVYIGESSKRDNAKAAGNYGEGLKMATLKLLKDKGSPEVRIGSDNWNLTYTLGEGNLSDAKVLTYSLDKSPKMEGNYFEFETSDRHLLETLRKSIQRFYNSGNPHFRCPDFENDILAVKILPEGEKGGVYIAGQRFEFDGNYDGLDGAVFMLKEKPPKRVYDPSRDRTSLNSSDLENLGDWLRMDSRMSNDDKAKLLSALRPYWDEKNYLANKPLDDFLERFLSWSTDELNINFPENYIAYSDASNDVVRNLRSKGYVVCKDGFSKIGMKTIHDLMGDIRKHDVVIPNDIQKKKILILKEAIKKLSPSLKESSINKGFSDRELDTHIYMFDRNSIKERKNYADCNAEAIIDFGKSKGFWIDKSYLDNASFSDALETALHELSHKVGGDETSDFSYMLTHVNKKAINQIMTDPNCRAQMLALNKLWATAGIQKGA